MEEVKKRLDDKLEMLNYSKDMMEDNKQETQIVLGEISGELAQIRMDLTKQKNLCHIISTQIKAAVRMNELLDVYQDRLKQCHQNIPKGARKQNIPGNIQDDKGIEKKKELENTDPEVAAKPVKDAGQPEKQPAAANVDQVEFISIPEFDTVPKYMKGRVQFTTMTTAVEELNTALQEKYSFLARSFHSLSPKEKKRYKAYKSQEGKNTAGSQFITAEELKNAQLLKSEHSRRSLITILRHLKKIREIRGPGSIVRFVPVHC